MTFGPSKIDSNVTKYWTKNSFCFLKLIIFIDKRKKTILYRTHHGTSMVWSLVKSNDFAPLRLEGVHMTHTPWHIPHQIEEGWIYARSVRKIDFYNLRTGLRLREIFKFYFYELTHQFENPHNYQNVQNKILFHFRSNSSTHAHARPRKI